MMRLLTAVALFGLAALGAACDDHRETAAEGTPGTTGIYISLGDSIAAGFSASDRETTAFAPLLARDMGLELRNVAAGGATTQDVIDNQLPWAERTIAEDNVALITISAGGNDLAQLVPNESCQKDPLPASCPLDDTLAAVEQRLGTIVSRLREANGNTPIVLLAYPNFFSGTGHPFELPASRVLTRLDDVIRRVAQRHAGVLVAETAPEFEGRGDELTHTLDRPFDPHPNDAGHRLIADAFLAALRGP